MADNPYLASLVGTLGIEGESLMEVETDPFPDETLSPGMSEFIRVARRYVAGFDDAHTFVDAIQEIANDLAGYLRLHQELLHSLPLSFPQQALGHLTTQALLAFSDGLSDMVACFSQQDLPRVDQGIERCKQAIIVVEAWWIEVCRVVRYQSQHVCSQCGALHQPEAESCPGCHRSLGPPSEEFRPWHDYIEVGEPWVELYRRTQAMVAGKLAMGDWSGELEEMRIQLVELQGRLRDIPEWEEESLAESYEGVFHGLSQLRSALESMQTYPHHRDLGQLNQAWFQIMGSLRMLGQPCADLRYELLTLLEDLEADSESEVE